MLQDKQTALNSTGNRERRRYTALFRNRTMAPPFVINNMCSLSNNKDWLIDIVFCIFTYCTSNPAWYLKRCFFSFHLKYCPWWPFGGHSDRPFLFFLDIATVPCLIMLLALNKISLQHFHSLVSKVWVQQENMNPRVLVTFLAIYCAIHPYYSVTKWHKLLCKHNGAGYTCMYNKKEQF